MTGLLDYLAERLPLLHALVTTRRLATLTIIALGLVAVQWVFYAYVISQSENWVTPFGPMVGGDFVVFYEAAKTPIDEAGLIYDFDTFNDRLSARHDEERQFALAWAYPPTMLFFLKPLSLAPYPIAYALWTGLTGGFFLWACYRLWPHRRALLFVVAAPAAFQTVITGQTGFLTAGLLALAAYGPTRHPILAGVAAGLLTVKPQLGVLLPIAFAACGAWRAIGVAAATAISLALASYWCFGADAWSGFLSEFTNQGERLADAILPFYKFTSVYGGLITMGAPGGLAMAVQGLASLAIIGVTAVVWRRVDDDAIRFAVLAAGAMLASPYAYYYELTVTIPAVLVIARRAVEKGWLRGEELMIMALWILPMVMPGDKPPATPIVFIGALGVFFMVARRSFTAAPVRFSSAAPSLAPGS